MKEQTKKKSLSNDAIDAITAVIVIAVFAAGMVYWLHGMPS